MESAVRSKTAMGMSVPIVVRMAVSVRITIISIISRFSIVSIDNIWTVKAVKIVIVPHIFHPYEVLHFNIWAL